MPFQRCRILSLHVLRAGKLATATPGCWLRHPRSASALCGPPSKPRGLKPQFKNALTAALKRGATQNSPPKNSPVKHSPSLRPQPARSARLARQLDAKRRALFFSAFDGNLSAVIAYHRLYYGETQPCAMLLGRVVRSEQARAFFLRQPRAGVGDRDFHFIAKQLRSDSNGSTLRQSVNCVEYQIRERAVQHIGIGGDGRQFRFEFCSDDDLSFLLQLRMKHTQDRAHDFVELRGLPVRLRHLGEFAEPSDDRLQIVDFGQQCRCSFAKYFFKEFRRSFFRADQILDGDLERK